MTNLRGLLIKLTHIISINKAKLIMSSKQFLSLRVCYSELQKLSLMSFATQRIQNLLFHGSYSLYFSPTS